jgi:hypothetical protein
MLNYFPCEGDGGCAGELYSEQPRPLGHLPAIRSSEASQPKEMAVQFSVLGEEGLIAILVLGVKCLSSSPKYRSNFSQNFALKFLGTFV